MKYRDNRRRAGQHRHTLLAIPVICAILIGSAFTAVVAQAELVEYVAEPGTAGNKIVFLSKAPLETIEGKTDQVAATIHADLQNLSGAIEVRVTVDMASLDTGNGKRNGHMRDNHLETDTYPEAVFTAGKIVKASAPALATGQSVQLTVAGTFELHGVAREVEYELELSLGEDGALHVVTSFPVSLEDHKIKRPKFLIMKLSDEQKVTVTLRATPR